MLLWWPLFRLLPWCPVFKVKSLQQFNTLTRRQNGRHFPDDILKCIFLNENVWISSEISLKFVPKGPINNIPALVQIMAWHRSGYKTLSELMVVSLLTHICITRPQWVKRTGIHTSHLRTLDIQTSGNKILHMPRQPCCLGMCKISMWSDINLFIYISFYFIYIFLYHEKNDKTGTRD